MTKKYIYLILTYIKSLILVLFNIIFNHKYIVCYYNLNQNPLSFNFFEYLNYIIIESNNKNKKIKLIINSNLNSKSASTESLSQLTRYNYFILQPLSLFQDIKVVKIINSTIKSVPLFSFKNTYIYDENYYKKILEYLKFNKSLLKFENKNFRQVSDWLKSKEISEKEIITITIRTKEDGSSRNSNIEDWKNFYEHLKNKNYNPIFIPDIEGPIKFFELNEYNFCLPASYNFIFRLYLMKLSKLNLFVNSGPACAALLFENNYVFYKPVSKNNNHTDDWVSVEQLEKQGININSDIEYFDKTYFRKTNWEEDNLENLIKTFSEFEKYNLN